MPTPNPIEAPVLRFGDDESAVSEVTAAELVVIVDDVEEVVDTVLVEDEAAEEVLVNISLLLDNGELSLAVMLK
jgi:hypothetical protein